MNEDSWKEKFRKLIEIMRLSVNDNPIDKPLECTKEGWSKKGDPTNLIIDHLKQYTDPVKVECFSSEFSASSSLL